MRVPKNRPPATPGEILNESFLQPLHITVSDFAKMICVSRHRLSEILNGRRKVTPDTAFRLEKALGLDAQFWLNAQLSTDLYAAMNHKDPAIDKIKAVDRSDMHQLAEAL